MHYWYTAFTVRPGVEIPPHLLDGRRRCTTCRAATSEGEYQLDMLDAQDVMAWVTQGPLAKRELEKLGTTDRGVILFRKMLEREIEKVARGRGPDGRDPRSGARHDRSTCTSNTTRRC